MPQAQRDYAYGSQLCEEEEEAVVESIGAHVALIRVKYDRLRHTLGLPEDAEILGVQPKANLGDYDPQAFFVLVKHPILDFIPILGRVPVLRHLWQGGE